MYDMNEQLIKIRKRMVEEATIYDELKMKLHTNPIKNRFNHFISSKMKSSVLDLLRSK